ncbi:VIT1/CCC1 transporter family protein [Oryzibacter oryziterrae]|uniref:VIT1/CCC1 transporter family protein n=1 Tax=Oryzibacter oryziterrae TaxID=2766474 RepID=UPI001F369716|nr:VIT family protein [Oryzibacter oryziterrae]
MPRAHGETHLVTRIGWLRAAVLGANDGILSTASLMIGVAAAAPDKGAVMVAGIAGLVAGAMSMAAGEYVYVSSQADTEAADMAREAAELKADPPGELAELAQIYQDRGLSPGLALQVAQEMMAGDALTAHARNELGITPSMAARPIQAGLVSAGTFAIGAALPLIVAAVIPATDLVIGVGLATLLALVALGATGARIGGAPMARGALRVTVWGAIAMLATALVGWIFGTVA